MKVAFWIAHLTGGGAESQVEYLSKGFADKGMLVTVYYLKKGPSSFNHSKNIKYQKISAGNKLQVIQLLFQSLRKENYSTVITCSLYFDILVAICSRFQNFTHIIRESNSKKGRKKTIKNLLRFKINKKTIIISNNISGQQMWCENGNESYFVKNGYNFPKLPGKKQNTVIIGGRFILRKKIEPAVEFFFKSKFFNNYSLKIIGAGPEKNNILRRLSEYDPKEERWAYYGFMSRDDLQKLFSQSSWFISLSDYEGTPNMVMEALAQDCSIILSDVECHRQYFPKNVVNYVEPEKYSIDAIYQPTFNSIDVKAFLDDWTENKMVREYMRIMTLIS